MKTNMIKNIKFVALILLFFVLRVQAQSVTEGMKLYDNEKYDAAKKYLTAMVDANKSVADNYFYLGKIPV